MIPLVLYGYGRMGKAVEEAAEAADDLQVKGRIDLAGSGAVREGPAAGSGEYKEGEVVAAERLAGILGRGDVVIEFSSPEGARHAARICGERGAALVSGSTGLSAEDEAALRASSSRVPVLRAANFSLGVMALKRVLGTALESLPREWDVEIVERHHRRKADSPSGTALMLAGEGARIRGYPPESVRSGRSGRMGPRPEPEIGVHAVRGGSWVGDHSILLAGDGEWLELRHVAESRSAFAQGAIAAARFVARAAPGLYTLEDIVSTGRTV